MKFKDGHRHKNLGLCEVRLDSKTNYATLSIEDDDLDCGFLHSQIDENYFQNWIGYFKESITLVVNVVALKGGMFLY